MFKKTPYRLSFKNLRSIAAGFVGLIFVSAAQAGLYLELGLGVPLNPDSGYMPDQYGVLSVGYIHRIDDVFILDVGFDHRSLTATDVCPRHPCGDNAIEAKLRLEW